MNTSTERSPQRMLPLWLLLAACVSPIVEPGEKEGFYVLDPLGNLILRYPYNTDARAILKDLERLLKYSSVG